MRYRVIRLLFILPLPIDLFLEVSNLDDNKGYDNELTLIRAKVKNGIFSAASPTIAFNCLINYKLKDLECLRVFSPNLPNLQFTAPS